jgi:hypothetical protein
MKSLWSHTEYLQCKTALTAQTNNISLISTATIFIYIGYLQTLINKDYLLIIFRILNQFKVFFEVQTTDRLYL